MEFNPYQSPTDDSPPQMPGIEPMECPECGEPMETGYVTTAARLSWRNWTDRTWAIFGFKKLPGTGPAFVGSNKLSGFRCRRCELVVFRYGVHKKAHAPRNKR